MKCRICQSPEVKILKKIRSPHTESEYPLYYCDECKCRSFNHLEYKIDFHEFYQSLSQTHQSTIDPVFKKKKSWDELTIKLIKLLGKHPESILDVGCRTGDFLMHFDDDTHREGVELAGDYADIAKKRGLTIYNDFIENISFTRKYDIVSCLAILEHLINPIKFLNSLNDVVADQGILVILIPTHESLKEKMLSHCNIRWHMYRPPEHLNFYSRSFLDEFMVKKGFSLVRREFTSGGMINPFRSIKILRKIFGKVFYFYDHSFFNRLPIFDHMYSIYKKDII